MAAPPAPVELPEELREEMTYRLPPENPACLFRASAVSRAWRALVTNRDFILRYRRFHKAPPILGLLQNCSLDEEEDYRFVYTATPNPPIKLPNSSLDVIDCRHGRVLIHDPYNLVVCNIITGEFQALPDYYHHPFTSCSGAVLCAVDGCNHLNLDCHQGNYRVVFTATFDPNVEDEHLGGHVSTWARLYSSATNSWTEPSILHPGPLMNINDDDDHQVMGPSLLVGDAVYFTLDLRNNRAVLRYDLGMAVLSEMNAPRLVRRDTFLVTTGKGGGLGVAAVEDYRIRLWSLSEGVWALWRDINLEALMPLNIDIGVPDTIKLKVIGFAEMSGVMFLRADDDGNVSTVELNSGRVSEIGVQLYSSRTIFPFESFYTPAIRNA